MTRDDAEAIAVFERLLRRLLTSASSRSLGSAPALPAAPTSDPDRKEGCIPCCIRRVVLSTGGDGHHFIGRFVNPDDVRQILLLASQGESLSGVGRSMLEWIEANAPEMTRSLDYSLQRADGDRLEAEGFAVYAPVKVYVEHSQYFRGVDHTREECGVGGTPREAYDDATEIVCQGAEDTSALVFLPLELDCSEDRTVDEEIGEEISEDSELYWHCILLRSARS